VACSHGRPSWSNEFRLTSFEAISGDVVGKFIEATKDGPAYVRTAAVRGLLSMETASLDVKNSLQDAARDRDPHVSRWAKKALQKFNCKIRD